MNNFLEAVNLELLFRCWQNSIQLCLATRQKVSAAEMRCPKSYDVNWWRHKPFFAKKSCQIPMGNQQNKVSWINTKFHMGISNTCGHVTGSIIFLNNFLALIRWSKSQTLAQNTLFGCAILTPLSNSLVQS